jgi:hypothetical protein
MKSFKPKKRTKIIIVMLLLIATVTVSVIAQQQQRNHFFIIDGQRVYVSNVINRNGRLYYPARELATLQTNDGSIEVDLDEHTQFLYISWRQRSAAMLAGVPEIVANGMLPGFRIGTAPFQHTDNQLYVPIRYVFESLGWRVTFNESLRVPEVRTDLLPQRQINTAERSRVDIQWMLRQRFDDVRHLFGNPIEITTSNGTFGDTYYFDTGVIVNVTTGRLPGYITMFRLPYEQMGNSSSFHFAGIDGTSTSEDVIQRFGVTDRASGIEEEMIGARFSYDYLIHGVPFAMFFFNDNNDVIAITTHNNIQGGMNRAQTPAEIFEAMRSSLSAG